MNPVIGNFIISPWSMLLLGLIFFIISFLVKRYIIWRIPLLLQPFVFVAMGVFFALTIYFFNTIFLQRLDEKQQEYINEINSQSRLKPFPTFPQ